MTHIELHNEAQKRTNTYQASEKDLIDILERIRNEEVYRKLGHTTFWNYLTLGLRLSDSEAGRFNSVIRIVSQVSVVKKANPESCKQEKLTPKSEELSRLSIPLSREAEENLKRVKEILSKKKTTNSKL